MGGNVRSGDSADNDCVKNIFAKVKCRLQVTSSTLRQFPSTWVFPCVVFIVLTAGGVAAVLSASSSSESNYKNIASQDTNAATQLMSQIANQMLQPTFSVGLFVQENPDFNSTYRSFPVVAAQLLAQVPAYNQKNMYLQLSPMAYIVEVYPNTSLTELSVGLNLINDTYTIKNLHLPPSQRLTIRGPLELINVNQPAMIVAALVFVPNVTRNTTFGMPAYLASGCDPEVAYLCYDDATHSKFWGIIYGIIYFESFINGAAAPLAALRDKGYAYQLVQEPTGLPATPGVYGPDGEPVSLLASSGNLGSTPVLSTVDVPGAAGFVPFTLMVTTTSTWYPSWRDPLVAAVVIIAAIIAAMLFTLLLYMRQHQRLLYALLPPTSVKSIFETDAFEALVSGPVESGKAKMIQADTPVEKLMALLSQLLRGSMPEIVDILAIRSAVMHGGTLLFQPQDLRRKLQQNNNLDDEVINALVRELQGLSPLDARLRSNISKGLSQVEITMIGRDASSLKDGAVLRQDMPSVESDCTEDVGVVPTTVHAEGSLPWALSYFLKRGCRSSRSDYVIQGGSEDLACDLNLGTNSAASSLSPFATVVSAGQNPRQFPQGASLKLAHAKSLQELTLLTPRNTTGSPSPRGGLDGSASMKQLFHRTTLSNAVVERNDSQKSNILVNEMQTITDRYPPSPVGVVRLGSALPASLLIDPAVLIDPALALLESSYGSWTFDVFQLSEATNGHPLSSMLFFLLHRSGIINNLKLDAATVARLSFAIEEGYEPNPYHNKTHAADVLQTMHTLLLSTGMIVKEGERGYCGPAILLACLLAAASHDLGHLGVTNDFLINNEDDLATTYSDKSPMEHYHLAALFKMMKTKSGLNVLGNLPRADRIKVRKMIIDLVSATDMKNHFTIFSQFSTMYQLTDSKDDKAAKTIAAATSSIPSNAVRLQSEEPGGANHHKQKGSDTALPTIHVVPVPSDDMQQTVTLQVVLKCADLSNIAKPLDVTCKWVMALEEEFFAQGDRERELGLTISPLFDRNKPGVSKNQIGFYDFMVLPLYHNFSCAFPGARPMVEMALSNYRHWKSKATC